MSWTASGILILCMHHLLLFPFPNFYIPFSLPPASSLFLNSLLFSLPLCSYIFLSFTLYIFWILSLFFFSSSFLTFLVFSTVLLCSSLFHSVPFSLPTFLLSQSHLHTKMFVLILEAQNLPPMNGTETMLLGLNMFKPFLVNPLQGKMPDNP